ncbi:MAG: uracil-DNA glycosylase family protein [Bacteroidales bacterium]|nr:uracil-DNA glycosylase family protein [Bacteroidales bacterium]
MTVESHPLEPFLPAGATILFLGSFPPPRARWSMDFFYPNFNNDFWRVMGLVHYGDAQHFVAPAGRRFNYEAVVEFCRRAGLAFFDTASKVRRLKDNASDAFLEIIEPTDLGALLSRLPHCHTLVTTGGKASEAIPVILSASHPVILSASHPVILSASEGSPPAPVILSASEGSTPREGSLPIPPPGSFTDLEAFGRELRWWRMPSTSRAYPLPLAAKASAYAQLWPEPLEL